MKASFIVGYLMESFDLKTKTAEKRMKTDDDQRLSEENRKSYELIDDVIIIVDRYLQFVT